jgi:hypothetical protein
VEKFFIILWVGLAIVFCQLFFLNMVVFCSESLRVSPIQQKDYSLQTGLLPTMSSGQDFSLTNIIILVASQALLDYSPAKFCLFFGGVITAAYGFGKYVQRVNSAHSNMLNKQVSLFNCEIKCGDKLIQRASAFNLELPQYNGEYVSVLQGFDNYIKVIEVEQSVIKDMMKHAEKESVNMVRVQLKQLVNNLKKTRKILQVGKMNVSKNYRQMVKNQQNEERIIQEKILKKKQAEEVARQKEEERWQKEQDDRDEIEKLRQFGYSASDEELYNALEELCKDDKNEHRVAAMLESKSPDQARDIVNQRGFANKSLLRYAISSMSPKIVSFLIAHGVRVNEKGECGQSPLLCVVATKLYIISSCIESLEKIIDLLLEAGADIDTTDNDSGRGILWYLEWRKISKKDILFYDNWIKKFIDHGADISEKNYNQEVMKKADQ